MIHKVSKVAKIRNRYNQVPHLTQDTNGKVTNYISIATDDDIIQFGNDVNIYTVYLSRAIIIGGNCLNWLEKTIVSDYTFC